MKDFPDFWAELHRALDQPIEVRNWSREGRASSTGVPAFSGKGSFAETLGYSRDVIFCGTVNTETLVQASKTEAAKLYEHWNDYAHGVLERSKLHLRSSTYLISIFHHFETLMERGRKATGASNGD